MPKKAPASVKSDDFYISPKVSIRKNTEEVLNKNFIPKDISYEDDGTALEQVGIAVATSTPVLLIAETGVGKTSLVRHLAHMTNNAFVRVNHNGGTTVEDIVGRWLIDEKGTKWVDGILIEAMKKGYWYLADEINAASAEINFVYHALLDDDAKVVLVEKDHEVVVPHPNFKFFGAMNPTTEYAGTKEINKALLSRFAVVKMDFCPPKVEAKIISDRTGVPLEVADRMVKFAVQSRANHAKGASRFIPSTRDLIMWASMFKVHGKYMLSAETSITNKASEDDIEAVKDLLAIQFKPLDTGKPAEPKKTPKEWVVGARVELTQIFQSSPSIGSKGTIVSVEKNGMTNIIQVEFDSEFITGHNCDGLTKNGHGYNVPRTNLALV